MTIYLDYIFIENFLIDYLIIKETSYISRKKVKFGLVLISSFVSSMYVVVMMYLKLQVLNYLICKILLIVIIIYISFRPKQIDEYLKLILVFFLVSVLNVGTVTLIENLTNINGDMVLKIIIYLVGMLLSKFFTTSMWKMYKRNIKNDDLIYDVKINFGDQTYNYKAFLDTGNNVFSAEHNLPILFAEITDKKIYTSLRNREKFYVETITLSDRREKIAYIFKNIEIRKDTKVWNVEAAIVFEEMKLSKDYNMILNYILYVDKMGGIKI